jgi:hypothetical protein
MIAHLELERAARRILQSAISKREALAYAEAAPFLKTEFAAPCQAPSLRNALRNLVLSWAHDVDGLHSDCVQAAIGHVLSAIELAPKRVSAAVPRRPQVQREIPTPYYVAKDL